MLLHLFHYNSVVRLANMLLYEEKLLVNISLGLHHEFAKEVSVADQLPLLGLHLFEL